MPRHQKEKQKTISDYYPKSSSPVKPKEVEAKVRQKKKRTQTFSSPLRPESAPNVFDVSSDESQIRAFKLQPSPTKPIVIDDDSDSDDENLPPLTSPVARRNTHKQGPSSTQMLSDSSDVEKGSESDSDSQGDIPLNLRPLKRKNVRIDSDSDEGRPRKRRVLRKGLKPPSEEEDLLEELDEDVVLESRLRPTPKKSTFSKKLERLKQIREKKGKGRGPGSPISIQDKDSEDSSEEDEEEEFHPIPGARQSNSKPSVPNNDNEDDTENDEDFIVEDDEVVQVVLPDQFSSRNTQPQELAFKVLFQLFVHVACQPKELRKEYMKARINGDNATAADIRISLGQIRRKLDSIRDSQVVSSLWSAEFKDTLDTHPQMDLTDMAADYSCDACRRSHAVSTKQARLSGEPYDPEGFQLKQDSSDSDESDSSEDSDASDDSSSEGGADNGSERVTLQLGGHCARRASLYHTFRHWEYDLFLEIEREIQEIQKVNKKRKKKDKKPVVNTDDPDEINVWLDKKGVINRRWGMIEGMKNQAQTVEIWQRKERYL